MGYKLILKLQNGNDISSPIIQSDSYELNEFKRNKKIQSNIHKTDKWIVDHDKEVIGYKCEYINKEL